jgi:hypothetical protein
MSTEGETILTCPQPVLVQEDSDICPICLDELQNIKAHPIVLGCSHSLCRECFENYIAVCIQQSQDLKCPLCQDIVCKRVRPLIVTVNNPSREVVEPRHGRCLPITFILTPIIAVLIVVIIMMTWSTLVS